MKEQQVAVSPLEDANRLPIYCGEDMHIYEEKWNAPAFANSFDCWGTDYYKDIYEGFVNGSPIEVKLEQVKRQVRIIEECHRQNPAEKFVEVPDTL